MSKIIVDSGCDVNYDMINNKSIDVVPLNLKLDNKHFIDDSNLDLKNYVEEMKKCKTIPRTSAPSPETYLNKYSNHNPIFVVTLSSKLSGSYNSANIAKDMLLDIKDKENTFIHIFDSLSASSAETLIALKIDELIKQNLKNEEIVQKTNLFINNLRTFFILERYDNLVKNGRLNSYVAKLASILSIKPICKAKNGVPEIFAKSRGFYNAMDKLINNICNDNIDFSNRTLAITHVNTEERAIYIKDRINKKLNFKDIIILKASGLVSTYADDEGIVVSY